MVEQPKFIVPNLESTRFKALFENFPRILIYDVKNGKVSNIYATGVLKPDYLYVDNSPIKNLELCISSVEEENDSLTHLLIPRVKLT